MEGWKAKAKSRPILIFKMYVIMILNLIVLGYTTTSRLFKILTTINQ